MFIISWILFPVYLVVYVKLQVELLFTVISLEFVKSSFLWFHSSLFGRSYSFWAPVFFLPLCLPFCLTRFISSFSSNMAVFFFFHVMPSLAISVSHCWHQSMKIGFPLRKKNTINNFGLSSIMFQWKHDYSFCLNLSGLD